MLHFLLLLVGQELLLQLCLEFNFIEDFFIQCLKASRIAYNSSYNALSIFLWLSKRYNNITCRILLLLYNCLFKMTFTVRIDKLLLWMRG